MSETQLTGGTYEVLRARLTKAADDLRGRLKQLSVDRAEVFGNIETKLIATHRVTTEHHCVPRDLTAIGDQFLFGYNVQFGLKTDIHVPDVLSAYKLADDGFHRQSLDLIDDHRFQKDFGELYKFYKDTRFSRFHVDGPHLHMVFQVGRTATDVKSFKWRIDDHRLTYVDNRSDHEIRLPPQHAFRWTRTTRDMHRYGDHPHVSIDDVVFVETVGGDLTIKVEDNTGDGRGIYAEPVDEKDQTLDDAEIHYAVLGNLVLLKIKPYREDKTRHFVFNSKLAQAVRVDEIADACVMLPGDQGVIFPGGYYLQTGEFKRFDVVAGKMKYNRMIASPNGEDYLYLFSDPAGGVTIHLRYNQIRQSVDTPLIAAGQAVFPGGEMVCFKPQDEPARHHALQLWQTPFTSEEFQTVTTSDSMLQKIGNKEIVAGMAECAELLQLVDKEDNYEGLYVDLVKKANDILDVYHWIDHPEAGKLAEPLGAIREASTAAVEEFEKVVRDRQQTAKRTAEVSQAIEQSRADIGRSRFKSIDEFVTALSQLRSLRGQAIALGDLKYVDAGTVQTLEASVVQSTDQLSSRAVEFLAGDAALKPYEDRVAEIAGQTGQIENVVAARALQKRIDGVSSDLELLTDTVSNLKIDDATRRTTIIDAIGETLASVNRVRAGLRNRTKELIGIEGRAEFASQLKLLEQTTAGYLEVADTPAGCDSYMTKVMVAIEELEGRFAEFDEFVETLTRRREAVYSAFESQKVALVEARNRRAETLGSSASRILSSIASRVDAMDQTDQIAAYFAGDLMVGKIRDIILQLEDLQDSVRAGDLQGRLKTIREDAVRGLKDRQDLYEDGGAIIKLGQHRFAVNTQPVDLTTVVRDDQLCLHLTATQYFEAIDDPAILDAKAYWNRHLISESEDLYRAEFLAVELIAMSRSGSRQDFRMQSDQEEAESPGDFRYDTKAISQIIGQRLGEGYTRGVHDHDAAIIHAQLIDWHQNLGLLRHAPPTRAAAWFWWTSLADAPVVDRLGQWVAGFAEIRKAFPDAKVDPALTRSFVLAIESDQDQLAAVYDELRPADMTDYLIDQLLHQPGQFAFSPAATESLAKLQKIKTVKARRRIRDAIDRNGDDPVIAMLLARDWVVSGLDGADAGDWVDECALGVMLRLADVAEVAKTFGGETEEDKPKVLATSATVTLTGLLGDHPRIVDGQLMLNYHDLQRRYRNHRETVMPKLKRLADTKAAVIDRARDDMRIEEFKPRVLSSFVRNRLIDEVYLPLIGDNLSKQMGTAGADKRTDRMGLLLLISPPGYGKTTLMEYVANRLGLVFMKINGPAIGHGVTSLDPDEAPNAAAREEVMRINLALEMGDNVMLYLDDIQHTHPELLQKFISLCDATRRIEGVRGGKTRTYDLRGRRVAVVMAGNPYTESGERFQIPDMLSNRADVYNLGEVVGDAAEAFEMSYLENCLTSNPALQPLAGGSPEDARTLIRAAGRGSMEGMEMRGNFSPGQTREMFEVLRRLVRVRDVVLKVNRAYIASAGQSVESRTEPPFKLQGSYRNMNRIAGKVAAVMNDAEVQSLIVDAYQQDAQTLTTAGEANVLKFKEIMGILTADDTKRLQAIHYAFVERNRMSGLAGDDATVQVMSQLAAMRDGLESIRAVIALAAEQSATGVPPEQRVTVQHAVPRVIADLLRGQFHLMQEWMRPVLEGSIESSRDLHRLQAQLTEMMQQYREVDESLRGPDPTNVVR